MTARPTGWRPTAFYFPIGGSDAFTAAAQLDRGERPAPRVEDPVDSRGIRLTGPWVLESYDEKFGHAVYQRPAGWGDGRPEGPFQLDGGPDIVGAARTAGYNVDQVNIGKWRLRTNDGAEVIGTVTFRDDRYVGISANGTPEKPLVTGPYPSLIAACDALDQLW